MEIDRINTICIRFGKRYFLGFKRLIIIYIYGVFIPVIRNYIIGCISKLLPNTRFTPSIKRFGMYGEKVFIHQGGICRLRCYFIIVQQYFFIILANDQIAKRTNRMENTYFFISLNIFQFANIQKNNINANFSIFFKLQEKYFQADNKKKEVVQLPFKILLIILIGKAVFMSVLV